MKRRIKTKKKKIKKYKSRNKLKSRKNKKRLKGGSLQMAAAAAAAGLAVGTGAIAYMGKDGPRKCMMEGCQSHYYHFYVHNRGWWDSPTSFYQGGKKANLLEEYKDDDYDGKKTVCPKCVELYDEGIRGGLLITTSNGYKVCDNSCGSCDKKYCDKKWWEPDTQGIYKEIGLGMNISSNWIDPNTKLIRERYCPECSMMFDSKKVCLKCNKPLKKIERITNGRVDYCISCYGKFLCRKPVFNLNGKGLKYGEILIFQDESKEYKAKIEGIFDNQSLRCEILSLNINEWNDIKLPWLRNKQDSDEAYMVEKTIIVINDLQICLRRLSLAKLLYEEYYSLNPDLIISIKEKLDIKLKPNVKPWVSINDPSRSEYKEKLEDELRIEQLKIYDARKREEGIIQGSLPH